MFVSITSRSLLSCGLLSAALFACSSSSGTTFPGGGGGAGISGGAGTGAFDAGTDPDASVFPGAWDSGPAPVDPSKETCDETPHFSGPQPDSFEKVFDANGSQFRGETYEEVESAMIAPYGTGCAYYQVKATYAGDRGSTFLRFADKPTEGMQTWPIQRGDANGGSDGVSIFRSNGDSIEGIGTLTTQTSGGVILIHGEGIGLEFDGYAYKGDTLTIELTAQ